MGPPKRVALNYSLKNIPIPTHTDYMKRIIEMVERLLKRMRWRAFYYLRNSTGNDDLTDNGLCDAEHYGLPSRRCPPQVEEMRAFESDMMKLIEGIKFRRSCDSFQDVLRNDVNRIRSSKAIFVSADKTRNLYELSKEQYNKLLTHNITKTCKLAPDDAFNVVNTKAQEIANDLDIANRMDVMAKAEAFITLKDHKDNFENSLPCRLINPAKSNLGIISKQILDDMNQKLIKKLEVTIWKNSAAVIEWFRSIERKDRCTFISFDIVNFYPSISEKLLDEALDFACSLIDIPDEDIRIIRHSRQSLLFAKERTWMKKDGNGLFDVTMGSYDGAELCELIGIYALADLSNDLPKQDMGLYRDDGLMVCRNVPGSKADRIRKNITKRFGDLGLKITIQSNLKVANFLDLTFDLNNSKYYPYRKPNDNPTYINVLSNHPPSILRNLPAAVSRRLTDNSTDRDIFMQAAPLYEEALKASVYR